MTASRLPAVDSERSSSGLLALGVGVGILAPGRLHVGLERPVAAVVAGLERNQAKALAGAAALFEVAARDERDATGRGDERKASRVAGPLRALPARLASERHVARVAAARDAHPAGAPDPAVVTVPPFTALEVAVR